MDVGYAESSGNRFSITVAQASKFTIESPKSEKSRINTIPTRELDA
jgi:hypothetical protein